MDLTRIPFSITTTLANNGARSGLIRKPDLSFDQTPSLDTELQVVLRSVELKPPNEQGDQSTIENFAPLVPAYSVASITFGCSLSIITWDRLPPKESFSKGSNVSEVHDRYFESKRNEALQVLSKLEHSRKLGLLSINLETTEKSFVGKLGWKEKLFLSSLELAVSEEYSLPTLKGVVSSWKSDNQSNIYLGFLDYIENQGSAIRETLERKPPDASSTSFPSPTSEDHDYAKDVLCICDPEFAERWKKLSSMEGNWPGIITVLKEQKRGRQLTEHDDNEMRELQAALVTVLLKCQELRKKVVEDFKPKQ